jgi:hypothetical protein
MLGNRLLTCLLEHVIFLIEARLQSIETLNQGQKLFRAYALP